MTISSLICDPFDIRDSNAVHQLINVLDTAAQSFVRNHIARLALTLFPTQSINSPKDQRLVHIPSYGPIFVDYGLISSKRTAVTRPILNYFSLSLSHSPGLPEIS